MNVASIRRKHRKVFEDLFYKKSGFLKKLPKVQFDGIRRLEEDKTKIVLNKMLGVGEFERDYSYFINNSSSQRQNENKGDNIINSGFKNRIANIMGNDFDKINKSGRYADIGMESYDKKDPKNFITRNNKFKNLSQNKKYRVIIFEEEANKNKNKIKTKRPNVLSRVGSNIVISSDVFDLPEIETNKKNV